MGMAFYQPTGNRESTFYTTSKSLTVTGNGAITQNVFKVRGCVEINRQYFIIDTITDITTCTAVSYDMSDGGASTAITLAGGANVSGYASKSILIRQGLVGVILTGRSANQIRILDRPASASPLTFNYAIIANSAVDTNYIRLLFTGDANTNFTVTHYVEWKPLSSNGEVLPA